MSAQEPKSQTLREQIEQACAAIEDASYMRNDAPPAHMPRLAKLFDDTRALIAASRQAADRLASLEQQDGIQDCEAHWFLQGGQSEFGEIHGEQNADDFISSVLGLVRSKRFALACSLGLGRGNTWEEIEAQVASLEQAQQALREKVRTVCETFECDEAQGYRSKDRQFALEVLRSTVPVTTADRNAEEVKGSL